MDSSIVHVYLYIYIYICIVQRSSPLQTLALSVLVGDGVSHVGPYSERLAKGCIGLLCGEKRRHMDDLDTQGLDNHVLMGQATESEHDAFPDYVDAYEFSPHIGTSANDPVASMDSMHSNGGHILEGIPSRRPIVVIHSRSRRCC